MTISLFKKIYCLSFGGRVLFHFHLIPTLLLFPIIKGDLTTLSTNIIKYYSLIPCRFFSWPGWTWTNIRLYQKQLCIPIEVTHKRHYWVEAKEQCSECVFINFTTGQERVIGIEPTSSAWKADALTVVLYPHGQVLGFAPTFYNLNII